MVLSLHFKLILMSHLCFQITGNKLEVLCVSVSILNMAFGFYP